MLYSLLNMNFRLIILLLVVIPLTCAVISETKLANAQISLEPISGPITRPISYFTYKISGTVIYKVNPRILKIYGKKKNTYIEFPAKGVKIEATNTKTMEKVYAVTDQYGKYSLDVQPGTYKVVPSDSKNTRFLPAYYWQPINKDTNMPFSGYPKTWPL